MATGGARPTTDGAGGTTARRASPRAAGGGRPRRAHGIIGAEVPTELGLLGRVVRLNLAVTQVLDEITSAAGLTVADYLVLGIVRTSPDGATTPTRICDLLGRTTGGMTLTLDRLEAAGWLVRSADEHDRRRVLVELTPGGRELATRVNEELHRWEESLDLGARERAAVDGALATLLDAIERRRAD
jgi:DNA-binding MarR family transcriptional regulator